MMKLRPFDSFLLPSLQGPTLSSSGEMHNSSTLHSTYPKKTHHFDALQLAYVGSMRDQHGISKMLYSSSPSMMCTHHQINDETHSISHSQIVGIAILCWSSVSFKETPFEGCASYFHS